MLVNKSYALIGHDFQAGFYPGPVMRYCQPNYKISPSINNVVFNLKSPLGDTKPNNFCPIFFVLR